MSDDSTEPVAPVASPKRRGRGPTKSFPLSSFEDALVLARAIHDHGVDGVLRRITVFDRLDRSPDSGSSRRLVTDAARYGLTLGSYRADQLRLTEEGRKLFSPEISTRERKETEFNLAIRQISSFNALYERLKDKRVPAQDVLVDQLADLPQSDRQRCATVFLQNLRYLGLLKEVAGADRIITIEHALDELPAEARPAAVSRAEPPLAAEAEPDQAVTGGMPAEPKVHIDINIHIDSSVSAEQVDQLFASMARHLYGREEQR
ncbi:MAG TPA: hypothetical protein VNN21_04920 [Dehalococcoidia bacterium]|nr:hypothetical protein [Dehalococcoidia bacterium]